MKLVLLCVVVTLDHITLTPRFAFSDVTISTIFLNVVHFCVHFVMMGFKQISSKRRGVLIPLYSEEKPQKFIAEDTGTFRKGAQEVLKQWSKSGESKSKKSGSFQIDQIKL